MIANGTRSVTIGDADGFAADCTMEIDGVTYQGTNGRIHPATTEQKP